MNSRTMRSLDEKRLRLTLQEERLRLGMQLAAEAQRSRLADRTQMWISGYRGLIALNGSSAIAFGALLQAIWTEPTAASMRAALLIGIGITAVGAALAASTFMTLYFGSKHKNNREPLKNPWWWAQMVFTFLSIACFLVAVLLVVVAGLKILG